MNYSICITTFNGRFEYFKNVVEKIKLQRKNVEFLILVNGLTNLPFDEDYRKKLLNFIAPFENTFPIIFPEFRGLAKIWNIGCQLSTNNYVLIISDDIDIGENFLDDYEKAILENPDDCFMINQNFCGFHINKQILDKLNWFDERFLSLGAEDIWFLECHSTVMGYDLPSVEIKSYFNNYDLEWQKDLLDNEVRMINQNHGGERYSPFNWDVYYYIHNNKNIFNRKEYPPRVLQYPHEKFFQEFKTIY